MKPFEVYDWAFEFGTHPAIIVSPAGRCANADLDTVNVIACSSQRAARPARVHEVLLDEADGLEWETLARCDVLYLAPKRELKRRRGALTAERRRQLGQKVIQLFQLWQA